MLKTDIVLDVWGWRAYREVSHSVPGVNMQDVNTLQQRLEICRPSTLIYVLFFCGGWGIYWAEVSQGSHHTSGRLCGANGMDGGGGDAVVRHTSKQTVRETALMMRTLLS